MRLIYNINQEPTQKDKQNKKYKENFEWRAE